MFIFLALFGLNKLYDAIKNRGEKSRWTVAPVVLPSYQRCNQTTIMVRFAGILTVSLSTRPQQLFGVILCSQNATLHTPPGTRWRCYRSTAWTSFKDKHADRWKHVKGQLSVIDRRERWPSFTVASTPLQSVHHDRRLGPVSVLMQQLCKMNQSASKTTTGKDKNCPFYLYLPWKRQNRQRVTPSLACRLRLGKKKS